MRTRLRCPSFVGRGPELRLVDELAEVVADGSGQMVVVAGDAGVGKSRLVDEVVRRRHAAGWLVAVGGCVGLGGEGLTHAALRELLRSLAGTDDDVLGDLPAQLAGISEGGDVDSARLFEQVLTVFDRLGRSTPLLVVFEDVHWADSSTRDLLAFLARNLAGARVLLLITYRADDVPRRHPLRPVLVELDRQAAGRIDLVGLDRAEVGELAEAVLGSQLPVDRLARLVARTDGNPFFVEELLGAADQSAALSGTVRELVLARLDGLDESTVALLRPAAVLGRRVDEPWLGLVTGLDAVAIERGLHQAVAAQVLELDGSGCHFRHDLVREAIYDDLLPGERLRLHGAAARAIEEHPDLIDPPGQRWALLAYHWSVVGDADRSLDAFVRAGRWARSVGAPAEAAAHFEAALVQWERAAVTPDDADRVGLMAEAAEAHSVAGRSRRAVELGEAALGAMVDPEPEQIAMAQLHLGAYRRADGDVAGAERAHREAVAVLADQPPSPTRALVLARLAGLLMLLQRGVEGVEVADAAIEMGRAVGDRRVEGHAMCSKGVMLGDVGRLDESLDLLHRSAAIAAEIGHLDDLARARQDLTYVQLFAGMAEEALVDAAAALEIVRRQGALCSSGLGIAEHQAEAAVRLGRFDEALSMVDAFPFEDIEGLSVCSFAAPRFDVWLRRGDLEAAAEALAPALERAAGVEDAQFGANTRIRAAQLALATGDLAAARRWVGEALDLSERVDDFLYAPKAFWVGVEIEASAWDRTRRGASSTTQMTTAEQGRIDHLHARIDRLATTQAALGGAPLAEPAAYLAMARADLAELAGETSADQWQVAVDAWVACGDVYWKAMGQLRLAEAILGAGGDRDAAAGALADAEATARALGAAPLLDAVGQVARRARLVRPSAASRHELGLTPREAEVLSLVAEGLTNRQIGEALYISDKTASVHVSNLLRKLGVESRREAAEVGRRALS